MHTVYFLYTGYRPGVTPDQLVDIASDPVYTWFYTQGNQISTQTAAKFVQLFGQCKYNFVDSVRQRFTFTSPRKSPRVYKYDIYSFAVVFNPSVNVVPCCVGSLERVVSEFSVHGEYLVYS